MAATPTDRPESQTGPTRVAASTSALRDAGPLSEGRYSPYNRNRGDAKRGGIVNSVNGHMKRPMESHNRQGGALQPTPAQLMWMYEQMQKPGFNPKKPLAPLPQATSSVPLADRISNKPKPHSRTEEAAPTPVDHTVPSAPNFTELCKYDSFCARPDCKFAHSTPAASSGQGIVLETDVCANGLECKDAACVKSHPSPAAKLSTTTTQQPDSEMTSAEPTAKSDEVCSAFPRCAAKNCPYKQYVLRTYMLY